MILFIQRLCLVTRAKQSASSTNVHVGERNERWSLTIGRLGCINSWPPFPHSLTQQIVNYWKLSYMSLVCC